MVFYHNFFAMSIFVKFLSQIFSPKATREGARARLFIDKMGQNIV